MFWRFAIGREDLEREVRIEVDYLVKMHGAGALEVALRKASRPNIRTARRAVLKAAARRLTKESQAREQADAATPAPAAPVIVKRPANDLADEILRPRDPGEACATIIVVGNEKGGGGKSTVAALIATTMLYRRARVAVFDLDLRQQSLTTFLANRRIWPAAAGVQTPSPHEYRLSNTVAPLLNDPQAAIALFRKGLLQAMRSTDIVVIDTPGADSALSRFAHSQADLVVTPMNDSFIDLDLLGKIDPLTQKIVRPSFYADVVRAAREARGSRALPLEWVVVRNRVGVAEAHNHRRVQQSLEALAPQAGFRLGPILRERVAYREIFPYGLTLADLIGARRPAEISPPRRVIRDELAQLVAGLGLDRHAVAASDTPSAAAPMRAGLSGRSS